MQLGMPQMHLDPLAVREPALGWAGLSHSLPAADAADLSLEVLRCVLQIDGWVGLQHRCL